MTALGGHRLYWIARDDPLLAQTRLYEFVHPDPRGLYADT